MINVTVDGWHSEWKCNFLDSRALLQNVVNACLPAWDISKAQSNWIYVRDFLKHIKYLDQIHESRDVLKRNLTFFKAGERKIFSIQLGGLITVYRRTIDILTSRKQTSSCWSWTAQHFISKFETAIA